MKAVEMGGTVFPGPEPGVELHVLCGIRRPFPPHFHDHYVIGLITEGRRRLLLRFPSGGEGAPSFSGEVEKGDLVVIRPFEIHACESIGGSSMNWKSLRLPPDFVHEVAGRRHALPPILRDAALGEDFLALCGGMEEQASGGRQREMLTSFMRTLVRKAGRRVMAPSGVIPPPFPDMLRWLAERRERPSLDAAARQFGVDKFSLLRGFSANFGITPYRCWESMRLGRALNLLRNGCAPVDVAVELGFADQSHLTRTFRNVFGMPPGVFRRATRTSGARGRKAFAAGKERREK